MNNIKYPSPQPSPSREREFDIVTEARSWINTPFHHQGRVKAVGCDCIGLIMGVVSSLGICDKNGTPISQHDRTDYPETPDGVALKKSLDKYLTEVTDISYGDILLFRFDKNPQHLGIVSDYFCGSVDVVNKFTPPPTPPASGGGEYTGSASGKSFISPPACGAHLCGRGSGGCQDLGIIHCYAQVGKVIEHRLDKKWKNRIVAAYRLAELSS